jgi:hypothetical protein
VPFAPEYWKTLAYEEKLDTTVTHLVEEGLRAFTYPLDSGNIGRAKPEKLMNYLHVGLHTIMMKGSKADLLIRG